MNKREKKSVLIGFILAIVLFIIFTIVSLSYIYPNIQEIESKKELLNGKLINEYSTIINNGLSFNEFKKLNALYKKDENFKIEFDNYYDKIYNKIDEGFYNLVLTKSNNNSLKYIDFLKKKNEKIKANLDTNEFKNTLSDINNILPNYSIYLDLKEEYSLNDLKFINYIERLLHKFNIRTTSNIGIKNIISVGENSSIYYIPLELDIKSTKGNLIKFIDYIQRTGHISLKKSKIKDIEGSLDLNSNLDIKKNIYSVNNNKIDQLSEINSILIKSYINSNSEQIRPFNKSLLDFLESTHQNNDFIQSHISLRFYVNGISKDKILNDINKVIGNVRIELALDKDGKPIKNEDGYKKEKIINYNYSNLFTIVKKLKSNRKLNKNENKYYASKLDRIYKYLTDKTLKKDFVTLKKELIKAKNLNSIYAKVLKYKKIFLLKDREVYSIIKALGLTEDKTDKNGKKFSSILPKNYYPQD